MIGTPILEDEAAATVKHFASGKNIMRTFIPITFVALIFLSACTIEQKDGELQNEFHPPLTYATWTTEQYKTEAGEPVCAVTSGYNGLSVLLRRMKDGALGISAKGERNLTPGMDFSVNVGGNHYRTSQEYFSASESVKLAEDLNAGGKAYLEWSEPHPHHPGRLRSSNILKLEDFAPAFEQCKRSLLNKAKR